MPEYAILVLKDKFTSAIIGLSLSDVMQEHARDPASAKEMFDTISTVFYRHTLVKKLRARHEFYWIWIKGDGWMLTFINCVHQQASLLKSMDADIDK